MKAKTKLLPTLLALCLSLGFLPATTALAADDNGDTGSTTATVTFESGGLVLENAPSLNFGTNAIQNSDMVLDSNDSTAYAIDVNDLRGNGQGWHLTAALSDFKSATRSSDSLPGAKIVVSTPTVTGTNTGKLATADSAYTLTSDNDPVKVMYAAATKGMDHSCCTWAIANVKLNVPQTAAVTKETHNATIAWVLTDGPGS